MSHDETTLSTLSHLEARLARLEHTLHGHTTPQLDRQPAVTDLQQVQQYFASLLQRVRTYAELLKIYHAYPTLFHPPPSSSPTPPPDLPPAAITHIVLAAASSFPATASALTAIKDTGVPDPALSAGLVALTARMHGVQVTQMAQAAGIAELRRRSERVVERWYEGGFLEGERFTAGVEARVRDVERGIRRVERRREEV